jgi:hypothetical protein
MSGTSREGTIRRPKTAVTQQCVHRHRFETHKTRCASSADEPAFTKTACAARCTGRKPLGCRIPSQPTLYSDRRMTPPTCPNAGEKFQPKKEAPTPHQPEPNWTLLHCVLRSYLNRSRNFARSNQIANPNENSMTKRCPLHSNRPACADIKIIPRRPKLLALFFCQ